MKHSFLSLALSVVLLASCSENTNSDAASERSDHASEVPTDQERQQDQHYSGVETPGSYSSDTSDAHAAQKGTSGNNNQGSKGSENSTYSAYDTPTSGRDSLKTSTGVAGQQGGGAGVGNGGSLNAAQSK